MVKKAKNFLIIPNNQLQVHLRLFQKERFKETTDAANDLIGNKVADKTTKISKASQQNNSKTVTNEHDKEVSKERYTFPEERQKIIDDLRLK